MIGGAKKNNNNRFAQSKKELAKGKTRPAGSKIRKLGIKIVQAKKEMGKSAYRRPAASQPALKAKKPIPRSVKPDINELSKQYGLSEEEIKDINERIDQSKRLIIISGVSFFMVLITAFWLINAKHSIGRLQGENDTGIYETWNSLSQSMQEQFDQIRSEAAAIDSLKEKLTTDSAEADALTSSSSTEIKVMSVLSGILGENSGTSTGQENADILTEKKNNFK